ncbi:MAG: hypothetical protein VX347_03095 [Bacteroidota bacterium]|nr:hypothetical protein [Bacteroidota bacterium]
MKKLLIILLCLPILFNSCTVLVPKLVLPKVVTNEEVLNKLIGKSKRDIMIEVGTPTKTTKFEDIDFWHYAVGESGELTFNLTMLNAVITNNASSFELQFKNDTVVRHSSINQPFGNEAHVRKKKFWWGAAGLFIDCAVFGIIMASREEGGL